MSFAKGFKKVKKDTARYNTAQMSTMESENKPLYPAPNIIQNMQGSDKVAAAGMPGAQPTKAPLQGAKGGLRVLNGPSRVTTDMGPYGAPKGAAGVTGVSNTNPFQRAIGKFGKKTRMGLTRIKRGF